MVLRENEEIIFWGKLCKNHRKLIEFTIKCLFNVKNDSLRMY